ncbi:MAG: zinc-binding alcohol dehydrogenase [Candidatus Rokuibacteriota bacterium]|nr:MAG: zinc-binding alcohol dehydrogenase [Candidatus Rokubacteria bacterium]
MKAYWISPGPSGTRVERRETPTPEPKAGEILVRVCAASLNRGELLGGAHGAAPKPGGGECAGEVVKVGDGVTGVAVGARMMGRCGGGYAEYALMDAREAMPVPAKLTWEEAAATPLTFIVVYDMLVAQGHLGAGQWLLVTGVSSGVGVAALQTGKALGARVIGTSGSAEKLARLEALGLDVSIRTRVGDFHDAVLKATDGKGVNLVVNNVGGTVFGECVKSLAFEGRLAIVGHLDRVLSATLDIEALHRKRLTVFGVSNRLRTAAQRAQTVRAFARDILPRFEDGRLRPLVDKVYPLDDLAAAITFMESDAQVGKIVVRV